MTSMHESESDHGDHVDFFISYTKSDEAWARWIAWLLERKHYRCIIQAEDFGPGTDFMANMRHASSKAKHVIAVLSPDYFKSRFAQMELNQALASDPMGFDRRLLPVRVKPVKPPDFMKTRIYIDLVDLPREEARKLLISKVEAFTLRSGAKQTRFEERPRFPGLIQDDDSEPQLIDTQEPISGPTRFLFIGTDPAGQLDLKTQSKGLSEVLDPLIKQKHVRFTAIFDVTAEDLLDALQDYQPNGLHLSGKQDGGEIFMRHKGGGVATVSDRALAGLLTSLDRPPRAVFLDTCYSYECARTLAQSVPAAVGVKSYTYDEEAIPFYEKVYRTIASGKSIKEAVAQGRWLLSSQRIRNDRIPELITRPGVNASKLRLVPRVRRLLRRAD
jgi:hypothetical protein